MEYYDPKNKKIEYEGKTPQEDPLKGNNFDLTNFNPVRNMPDMNHSIKEEKPLTQEECDALMKKITSSLP
jgi:hypothetical protein